MTGKKTILLVEDEAFIRVVEMESLKDAGYEVIAVPSGEKAIEAMRTGFPVNLILMDINLGKGMDGTDAAQEILKDHDIPVVFLSNRTEKDIVEKTEKITSYGYVVKNSGITVLDASIKMAFRLHRAHKELKASRQQLKDIIDFQPDATFVIDNDKKVIAWNKAMEEMTGVKKEDIIGQGDYAYTIPFYGERRPHLLDLIDISDEELKTRYSYIKRKGHTFYAEIFAPALYDGKGAYVWATGAPLFDTHGSRMGAIESIRDITDGKRAEGALREVQARYRLLFEHAPDGIVIIDPATARFVEFNETAHRQLGYSREEFAGLSIPDIEAVESPEETQRRIETVIRKGRDDFESIHRTRQGEIRNIHVTAQMTKIAGHEVYHCVWRDITKRKRAEEALRETKEKYRELVENANSIILRMDSTGIITFFNEFSQRFFGYTEEEILGKNVIGTIVPPVDSMGLDLKRLIDDIGRNPDRYSTNINENVRRNGERVWIAWTNKPVLDEHGRVAAILCIGNDITAERRTAEALRTREHDLEIKSRSLEEANTALRVVLRYKEEDKETLENTFLANVRELVLPYIDKLESTRLSDMQKAYVSIAKSNLNDIISPFLQKMSVIDSRLTPTELQIALLIKEGRSSKEIAQNLNIGTGTVDSHRKSIRGKLGLNKEKVNLQSYLRSLK